MTRRVLRSPLTWVGGKARLLDWLLPLLDVPCSLYAEPFGGSASVLLNRPRVEVEVYNDLDGALVTFLLCVKHHPQELERLVTGLPYARSLHAAEVEWLRLGCPGRLTDLQFAARWYWLNLAGFSGGMGNGFGAAASEDHVGKQHGRIMTITQASLRLRDVLFENCGFAEFVQRYDRPEALFYCDPPYLGTEDCYSASEKSFGLTEHRELARLLGAAAGKVAVSYGEHPLLSELYPAPHWRRCETQRLSVLANDRRECKPKAITEVLLTNYDLPRQAALEF